MESIFWTPRHEFISYSALLSWWSRSFWAQGTFILHGSLLTSGLWAWSCVCRWYMDMVFMFFFVVGHLRILFPCRNCLCASKFADGRPSLPLVEQVVARMISIWPPKRPISLCLARKRPFWFVSCCNPSCDLLWILWYFFGSLLSSRSSSDQIALHLRIGPLSWPGVRFWSPMPPRAQHGIDPKESDPGSLWLAHHLCIWHKG